MKMNKFKFFIKGIFGQLNSDEQLAAIARFSGIWMFYDSRSEITRVQINTLVDFSKKHPFSIMFIPMNEKVLKSPNSTAKADVARAKEHAALLKITEFPATYLVTPPHSYQFLGTGFIPEAQLEKAIIDAHFSPGQLKRNLDSIEDQKKMIKLKKSQMKMNS